MFSSRLAEHKTLLITIDFIIIELTILLAFWIMALRADWTFDSAYLLNYSGWFIFLPALWFLSAFLTDFYEAQRTTKWEAMASSLFRTVALVIVIYLFIYFFFAAPGEMPRGIVGYQGAVSFILIGLSRVAYFQFVKFPVFARPVIIVGAGWAGQTIAQIIYQYASTYYCILGFVDDDPTKRGQAISLSGSVGSLPVIGTSRDLVHLAKAYRRLEIVLAVTRDLNPQLFQTLLECKEQGVPITLMPVLFEQFTKQVPIDHIGDNWNVALPLDSADVRGLYPIAKRILDITGALCGLSVFFLLFPLIVLAIYLDSGRPIFFTQKRLGKGGKIFKLFKLRTMFSGAEGTGEAVWASKTDPRITRVGKLLRKTRLDEMPQLINVLKGEMSAVGPRPERPEHHELFDKTIPFHRLRLAVNPGMAGWAAVNFDYVDSIDDAKIRLQYDLYYIKHQSIWFDILILLRMMGQMLALRGR